MNIKTGILAAAAALALTVPAAAFAQPYYGDHGYYGRHEEFRRDHDDWRRIERQRERRREEWRRERWEREHAYRGYGYGYVSPYYR